MTGLAAVSCQPMHPVRPANERPATAPAAGPKAAGPAAGQPARAYGAERTRLVSAPDEIVSVLENGATVISKRVAGSPVLAVRGYVRTGGIYEGQWLGGGLSHLLEHLVAGGSTRFRSEAENRAILEKIGNNSNAYTSTGHTAYFVNTTPANLADAVGLVTGWMLHATITSDEFAREREVVQRELEMGRGDPGRQFYYLSQLNRYRVSPARVPVIGYQEVIQNLTRDDVYNYYQASYQPGNMVFAVAGDLDPEEMLRAVRKHLNVAPPGRVFSHDIAEEPQVLTPRTLVATMPKLGDARLLLKFPTIKLDDPALYALDVLASAMSDGESALLVREIRFNQKLATHIDAYSHTPEYVAGTFAVTLQTPPEKLAAARDAVLKLLEDVKTKGIEPALLERAKTQMRVGLLKSRQTAADIAGGMATDYLSTGDPHFSDRYIERVLKVSADEVQAAARKYLDASRLITTLMLPQEYAADLPRAEDLTRAAAAVPAIAPAEATPVARTTLENGSVLLVKRVPTSDLVSVKVFASGGLTAEDENSNGIGNFAMRVLSRGAGARSGDDIAEAFDAVGADYGAGCGNNTWFWSLTCTREELDRSLAVFGDVVLKPTFPEGEVNEMRRNILSGIASQDAVWTNQAMRYFRERYFSPMRSPYRFQTIGRAENVQRFSVDDLRKWYTQRILTSRRVVAIYGNIEPAEAQALAAKYLGGGVRITDTAAREPDATALAPAMAATAPTVAAPAQALGSTAPAFDAMAPIKAAGVEIREVHVQATQQPVAGVFIGFDSASVVGDHDTYTLTLADTLTSGYGFPTGYLHQVLRGQGLVYVVHAQNWPGRSAATPGTFFVYAGCTPEKVNEVVRLIIENVARLQGSDADIQPDWFGRARQLTITDEAMSNETVSEQASTAALDELMGLGYDYRQKFAAGISGVELEELRKVAAMRLNRCVVTVSTPEPSLVKLAPGPMVFKTFSSVDLAPTGVSHAPAGAAGK
jgi:zinc protease